MNHLAENLRYLLDGVPRGDTGKQFDRDVKTIRRWLSGESEPGLDVIAQLAAMADVDPGHLAFMDPTTFRRLY